MKYSVSFTCDAADLQGEKVVEAQSVRHAFAIAREELIDELCTEMRRVVNEECKFTCTAVSNPGLGF